MKIKSKISSQLAASMLEDIFANTVADALYDIGDFHPDGPAMGELAVCRNVKIKGNVAELVQRHTDTIVETVASMVEIEGSRQTTLNVLHDTIYTVLDTLYRANTSSDFDKH